MNLIEIWKKWQKIWKERQTYKVLEDKDKKSFYILDMFPYPSWAWLHVGHPKWYIATDVIARKHMLQWEKVLHPMGFDTFGLGTEQYAIANKMKPQIAAAQNITTYKRQLEMFGCTYDWDREVNTADPKYFKWTQKVFLDLYNSYFDEEKKCAKSIADLEFRIENWEVNLPESMTKEQFLDIQRLAYLDYKPINRCPNCKTWLANEDLNADWTCERCGTQVEQKPMKQRVIRITKYAERLLDWLRNLPGWSDSTKDQQRNWIGKSEWTQFELSVKSEEWRVDDVIEVYTTRIDTVFGMSFVVMAPEHKLVESLKLRIEDWELRIENWDEIQEYIEKAKHKTQLERTELQKEKTWVIVDGIYAINPFNDEKVPIYIWDYVLANYGTGVVMAVPAHDERDFEFAKKYGIKIKTSITNKINNAWMTCVCSEDLKIEFEKMFNSKIEFLPRFNPNEWLVYGNIEILLKMLEYKDIRVLWIEDLSQEEWKSIWSIWSNPRILTEKWILVDSWEFTWMTSDQAIENMQKWLNEKQIWWKKINYRLQDRVFSRQRYRWEPIPMIHCDNCGIVPLEEKDLPLELPDVENYEPTGTEEGPLADIEERINVKCPKCGWNAKRESNTMPGWAGSSRYWMRYMDPNNEKELVSSEKEKFWHPVDIYVWWAEHITRHMIYARFWHKFLQDLWIVSVDEPFKRYQHVWLIMAEDGRKMSKRRWNVINPDDIINEFGSDTLRMYEMFMWPFDQAVNWNTNGVKGVKKFLDKVVSLKLKVESWKSDDKKVLNLLHKTIKKVTEDIDTFGFNTAISQMMILVNELTIKDNISQDTFEKLVILLAPFAPHLSEELWETLWNQASIFNQNLWPKHDETYLIEDTVTIAVQINGKVRWTIDIAPDISQDQVFEIAKKNDKINKYLEWDILKIIYIPWKICNIIVKS